MIRLVFLFSLAFSFLHASAQAPLLRPGMAAITTYALSGDVGIMVDDHVVCVFDVRPYESATAGTNFPAQRLLPAAPLDQHWKRSRMGSVFGIVTDTVGNIYVTAGMQYGFPNTGTAGAGGIYKIKFDDWTVSDFITTLNAPSGSGAAQLSNTGVGLGNLAYEKWHDQLFVTNFEDGKIYRISSSGTVLSSFDPFAGDDQQTGVAPMGELLWGVDAYGTSANDVRLYFARWKESFYVPNIPTAYVEIWSVQLDASGNFSGSEQLEIQVPDYLTGYAGSMPVSDISFSGEGKMLLCERSMIDHENPAAHQSRLLEYKKDNGSWQLFHQYTIGAYAPDNTAGGADYGFGSYNAGSGEASDCQQMIWASGDALLSNGMGYGMAGTRVENNDSPGLVSNPQYPVDYNNNITDSPKSCNGGLDIFSNCRYVPPPPAPCGDMPNVITPNGDAINDYFVVPCEGEWTLSIFNRWGNRIYSQANYENDFNGKELSDGVYYYVLEWPEENIRQAGFFHLIRPKN